jgi:hypothetical protein
VPRPSTVKVREAINAAAGQLPELQRQASGMSAVALAAVAPFLPNLIGQAAATLPDDPAQLDELLQAGADWLLSLRSDEQPEPPAEPVELPAGELREVA